MTLSSNTSSQKKREVSKKVFTKFLTSLPLNPYTRMEVQKLDGAKDFVRGADGKPYKGMLSGNAPIVLRKTSKNHTGQVVFNHDSSGATFVEGTTALEGNETAIAPAGTAIDLIRMRTGVALTDFEAESSEIDVIDYKSEFIIRALKQKLEIEQVKALVSMDGGRVNLVNTAGAPAIATQDAWYAANLTASRVHFVDHAACIAASTTDFSAAGAALDAGDILTAAVARAVLAKTKSPTGANLTPFEVGGQSQKYLWLVGSTGFEQLANDATILAFQNAVFSSLPEYHPGLGANCLKYRNFEIVEVPEIDNYVMTAFGGAGVDAYPSFVLGVGGLCTAIARESIHKYEYDADGTKGVAGTLWMGAKKLAQSTALVDAEVLTVFHTAA